MCVLPAVSAEMVYTDSGTGSPTWENVVEIASLNAAQECNHQKYMMKWRERFQDLCNGVRYGNWPNIPNLKNDQDNHEMYICMLVLYIRCKKTLLTTYKWEKEFISLSSTVRGQHLMMGQSGLKPDRSLDRQVEQRLIQLKEDEEQMHYSVLKKRLAIRRRRQRLGKLSVVSDAANQAFHQAHLTR